MVQRRAPPCPRTAGDVVAVRVRVGDDVDVGRGEASGGEQELRQLRASKSGVRLSLVHPLFHTKFDWR